MDLSGISQNWPIFRYSYLSGRFAPAATARLADGFRCARRQAGGVKQGGTLFHPKPTGFCPQLSRAFPARTRVHFCTHKSEPKKRQTPLGWTPALSNRTPAMEDCAATETPRFGWLLVIGAAIVSLRLACARMGTALGMIGLSCRAKQIDPSIPSKGRQAKLDKIPGEIRSPKDSLVQGHRTI